MLSIGRNSKLYIHRERDLQRIIGVFGVNCPLGTTCDIYPEN